MARWPLRPWHPPSPTTYQQDPQKEKVSPGTPRGAESSEEEEGEQVCQGRRTVYERQQAGGAADGRQPNHCPGAGKGQEANRAWGERRHRPRNCLEGQYFLLTGCGQVWAKHSGDEGQASAFWCRSDLQICEMSPKVLGLQELPGQGRGSTVPASGQA